jgi:glutaredoxin 3
MAQITIYTTQFCPYCHRAKALLTKKGANFHEIDVSYDPAQRAEMTAKAHGRRTVPQIFVDGKYVGDCDAIHALDARGALVPLLERA